MESSDDSFAWMSASSDSSDSDSKGTNMSAAIQTKAEDGDSTDNKKKLKKRLFGEGQGTSEVEPPPKRKKKLKRESEVTLAHTPRVKCEPESDADAELARRVKQEQDALGTSLNNHDHATTNTHSNKQDVPTSESDMFVNHESKSERKKSKKKKRNNSLNMNTDVKDMIVEDIFSAEETVVEKRQRKASEVLSQKSHRDKSNGDKDTDSQIDTTYTSKEFVSTDSSSSAEDRERKKKKKKQRRNSQTPKIKLRESYNDDTSSNTQETNFESVKKSQQILKLSDRICYEDENESEVERQITVSDQTNNTATQSIKLKRFIKANPYLKAITARAESDSLITRDDEVWVLKCPHELDISSLAGKDLQLDTKCKLKIDGQAYDGSLNEERGKIAILSCAHNQITINNISLIGTVNFRKRIPKPHFVEDNVMLNNQTNFIPLPDTKCRHPLFGSNYKKAMKIPSTIKARLKDDFEPQQEHKKKKKKKKHREEESGGEPEPASAHKSHKKRKHQMLAEEVEGDMPPPKKSKKIKNEVSADTWESEKAIEENLFNF